MQTNTYNRDTSSFKYDMTFQYIFRDYPYLHDHDYWEFPIVLTGEIKHTINGSCQIFDKNTAYLIRPKDCHLLEKKSDTLSMLNILMRDSFVRKMCSCFSEDLYDNLLKFDYIRITLDDKQTTELFNSVYALQENSNDDANYQFLERIILASIIAKVAQLSLTVNDNKPRWLSELLQQAHILKNRKWQIQDLLDTCGYSQAHLCRIFNQYLGCTPIQYLTKIKMIHACNYLNYSDLSIIEIAFELGYTNSSHFNHVFKAHFHMSPMQYRKSSRSRQC